jgi:hypothetical protein
VPEQPGLSDEAIEQETAVALPERDALSLVDGGIRLVPMSPLVAASPKLPIDPIPEDPTGEGA